MPHRHHFSSAIAGAVFFAFAAITSHAQQAKPGEISAATSITGVNTFDNDLDAGASVYDRLSIDDANGNGFAHDDYKTAPAIGITLAHRF